LEVLFAILPILGLIIWIATLISIFRSDKDTGGKVLWCVLATITGIIGIALWWFWAKDD
jgi:hypothetical protein